MARVELVGATEVGAPEVVAGPVDEEELALEESDPQPARARLVSTAQMMATRIGRIPEG